MTPQKLHTSSVAGQQSVVSVLHLHCNIHNTASSHHFLGMNLFVKQRISIQLFTALIYKYLLDIQYWQTSIQHCTQKIFHIFQNRYLKYCDDLVYILHIL